MAGYSGDDGDGSDDTPVSGTGVSYDGGPVGHRKPPASGQFRKGQKKPEGSGRRKGQKNTKTIVRGVLAEEVTITEKGKTRKISMTEAVVRRARANAMKSDNVLDQIRFFDLAQKLDPDSVIAPEPIVIHSIPGDDGL